MSRLLELLLQPGAVDEQALMNEAVSLFDAAANRVYSAESKGGLTGSDTFMPELSRVLSLQLAGVNLLGEDYQRIYGALERWVVMSSLDVEDDQKVHALIKSGRVRDFLKDYLLPTLRLQQQFQLQQKRDLKQECANYIEHLRKLIEKKQAKEPASHSLEILRQKQQAMLRVAETLETNERVDRQLAQFRAQRKAEKGILEARRYDFTEMTILKAIATILSLSLAYWAGIWKTEGEKSGDRMESILEKALPERAPSRRRPRQRQG